MEMLISLAFGDSARYPRTRLVRNFTRLAFDQHNWPSVSHLLAPQNKLKKNASRLQDVPLSLGHAHSGWSRQSCGGGPAVEVQSGSKKR